MSPEGAAAYDEALHQRVYGDDGHMHFYTELRWRWLLPGLYCRCGKRP